MNPVQLFNPFRKPIDELRAVDLLVLKTVREGWHVDYKKAVDREPSKAAKHISSFANHFGGWLFYGVDQTRDAEGKNVAGEFVGVPLSRVSGDLESLRNSVAQHMSPPCYYREKVLEGPCAEIQLLEDRAVIVIEVPMGARPPYVHSSGSIFRRIADSSEPKAETDRSTLDLLWERSRGHRDNLKHMLRTSAELPAYNSVPHLHLFFSPTFYGEPSPGISLNFDRFAEVMSSGDDGKTGLPFDHIFPSINGAVARQVLGNSFDVPSVTWRYSLDGSSVVSMAFSTFALSGNPTALQLRGFLSGHQHVDAFVSRALEITRGSVVDLSAFFFNLLSVLYKHWRLAREHGLTGAFYVRGRIDNAQNAIPYVDTPGYAEFVRKWGLPVVLDNVIELPFRCVEDPIVLSAPVPDAEGDGLGATGHGVLISEILASFGLPFSNKVFDSDAIEAAYQRAQERAERARSGVRSAR